MQRLWRILLVALVGLLGAAPAYADEPPSKELGAYVDGVVSALMLSKGVAGATVSVVDRDGILYERGYGIASQHEVRPVDPAATLFRAGSISKTFTYVATMQLAQERKIDLQADVNTYLPAPLQIPDEGFGPVRVWNLMTHTAGFEDAAIPHLFRLGDSPVETLDAYLAKYRPHRVRPPGQHADYSNYSVALLGALVSHVAGKPFEQIVDERLFQPLGMTHSTFREPLPASDPRRMPDALIHDPSTPFRREQGAFKDEPYEHVAALGPAGALSTTAHDMTRWMRMLLRGGELDGVRVLAPETFQELATVTFRNAPGVSGIAHGLFRTRYGRYESLEHGGATLAFMSNMVVLPEAGLGVFVSTNTDVGGELSGALPRMIFERLLPDARPAPVPPPGDDFEPTAKRLAGSYATQRRSYTTLEKLLSLAQPTTVAVRKDGLAITSADKTSLWIPESPLLFRSKDTGARIEFLEGPSGAVVGYAAASSVADSGLGPRQREDPGPGSRRRGARLRGRPSGNVASPRQESRAVLAKGSLGRGRRGAGLGDVAGVAGPLHDGALGALGRSIRGVAVVPEHGPARLGRPRVRRQPAGRGRSGPLRGFMARLGLAPRSQPAARAGPRDDARGGGHARALERAAGAIRAGRVTRRRALTAASRTPGPTRGPTPRPCRRRP